jgi:GNAT superfamily N-acetyltransferase
MNYSMSVSSEEDENIRQALVEPLRAFNQSQAGPSNYRPLVIALRDESGSVRGGVWGYTAYGWLFVQFLVVPEQARGTGIGRRLMALAESEAVARGCRDAWLDTHEFQANGFYERLGYISFGELPNYPAPFSRFFFRKQINTKAPGAA